MPTGLFSTDGVISGDYAVNATDSSEGAVVTVDSEIQLTNIALTGGTDDEWEVDDAYEIQTRATFGAAATTFTLDLIMKFLPKIRDFTAIGFNSKPVRKSQATNSLVEWVDITINHTSCTRTEFNTLLEWMANSVDIKMEDGDSGAIIQTYFGRFLNTNYLGTWSKG